MPALQIAGENAMATYHPSTTKLVICARHPFTLWHPAPEMRERVQHHWPEMRVLHLLDYDLLPTELPDADIFVGYSLRPQQLAIARQLKWIHSTAAGVMQLMYPELRQSGIAVTNASGVHNVPIAEHVLGLMIALARRFPDCFREQQRSKWAQQEIWDARPRPRELQGQVALLIGLGEVGQAIARAVRALGMRVRAVTRTGTGNTDLAERIQSVDKLEVAIGEADFVVLAAPETSATYHLIGPRQFAAMRASAYFINVSRGSLVDEAALIEAVATHKIAGAALDVAEQEPLPRDSPLWKCENLLITPHLSAASEALWTRQTDLLLENLKRWFSGRDLLNRVDLNRGY